MLQGGEGCQEFARVVGDLPVQTLDLTAHTSGECSVTAVISNQAHSLPNSLPASLSAFYHCNKSQTRPTLKRVILTLLLV